MNKKLIEIASSLKISLPKELMVLELLMDRGITTTVRFEGGLNISGFKYLGSNLNRLVIIDSFIKINEIEHYWKGRMGSDLWDENSKFLSLASCKVPEGSRILFSLNNDDFGSIWLEYYEEEDEKRLKMSNNFIDFLLSLEEIIFEDRIQNCSPIEDKLFKNWGESYWRIRQ